MKNRIYNFKNLLLFNLKKDHKKTFIWLGILLGFTAIIVSYYLSMTMTDAERQLFVETLKNPAIILICGLFPEVKATVELTFAIEMTLFTAIIVAIMNIFFVSSNTREDEEEGRLELIRSLPTGHQSTLVASILQMFIINVVLTIGITLIVTISGMGVNPLIQGIHFGIIFGAFGFMFACITSLFAQLFKSRRTVNLASFAFLGVTFLYRGITDMYYPSLSWLSPLSWPYKATPYVSINYLPIILMLVLGIISFIISFYLNSIRDLGESFIKSKGGRVHASSSMLSIFGFSLKLNKTMIISWAISMFLMALTFGVVFADIGEFINNNSAITNILGDNTSNLELQFMVMMNEICFIIVAIPVILIIKHLHNEEKSGRLENIVSKPINKTKLLGSYVIISILLGIVLTVITSSTIYLAANGSIQLALTIKLSLLFLFSILFILSIAVFIIGICPKLMNFTWVIIGYAFCVSYFAEMLRMPEWLRNISPFHPIVTMLVNDTINVVPIVFFGIGSLILGYTGFISYSNRDINC